MNLQTHVSLMHPREFINAFPDAIECRIALGENTTGTALAFNARGNMLAVGCYDGSVKIIDFWTREIIRELANAAAAVNIGVKTEDTKKSASSAADVAVASSDGGDNDDGAVPMETESGEKSGGEDVLSGESKWQPFASDANCGGHSAIICSVSWYSDNRKLLTAAYDNRIILWDVLQQRPEKVYTFATTVIRAEVNPKNQLRTIVEIREEELLDYCLVSRYNDIPCIVNTVTDEILNVDVELFKYAQKSKQDMITVKYCESGKRFYVGNSQGQITIFEEMDTKDSRGKVQYAQITTFNVSPETASIKVKSLMPVLGIQCSRRGNYYLINSESRLKLFRRSNSTQSAEFRDAVQHLFFSYCCFSGMSALQGDENWDSEYVVGCSENKIYIWDIATHQLQKILEGPNENVICMEWHPYRPIIASSTIGGYVYVWVKSPEGSYSAFDPEFEEIEANDMYLEREDEFDEDLRLHEESLIETRKRQIEEEDCGFVDVVTVKKSAWDMDLNDNEVHLTCSPISDRQMRQQQRLEQLREQKREAMEQNRNRRRSSRKSSTDSRRSRSAKRTLRKSSKKSSKRKRDEAYDDSSYDSDQDNS